VHDMPAPRTATILDQEQQKRMESDLVAARNRQPGQEKNRLRDAQKKARDEAKAKEAKDKGKGKGKDSNKPQNTLARPPATVANAPAANPPAASPWPVPSR